MPEENKTIKILPPQWGLGLATALVVILVVFLGVLTWNEIKKHDYIGRSEQQIYTITISGEGKIVAIPDIATISLGIQTEKKTVADAQKENTDKMNSLIKELKGLDIEAKDIQTANYSIYPRYDWTTNKQVLIGYNVSQTAEVKIRDLEKVGTVIEAAGRLGANQIGGLNFTIDEPEKLRQQAREKALENAKEKADALAKIAGVKLGRLVSFTEDNSNQPYPIYKSYALEARSADSAAGMAPQVEPGSQDVIVNVTVTYEVL